MEINNKETDMFGNEVKEGDTICVIIPGIFPDSPNAEIAECGVFFDTDKDRLAYRYPADNMIYALKWNRERFWLKGCKQMQPQSDPNLVKEFEGYLKSLVTSALHHALDKEAISLQELRDEQNRFLSKYTPYLQPHNTDKDGN